MENQRKSGEENPQEDPLTRWVISQTKCTGCRRCLTACSAGLLKFRDDVIYLEEKEEIYCDECGACAKVCGARAITFI